MTTNTIGYSKNRVKRFQRKITWDNQLREILPQLKARTKRKNSLRTLLKNAKKIELILGNK